MLGLGLNITKSAVGQQGMPIPDAPVAWYNDKSLSLLNEGQAVSTYKDVSEGTSFDLAQSDSGKQPLVSIKQGRKAIHFTNDTLFSESLPVLTGTTDFTIFYAGESLSEYHTAIYVGDDDIPDNTSSFRLGRSTSNRLRAILGDGAGGLYETTFPFSGDGDIAYAYKNGLDSSDIYIGLDNGVTDQQVAFPISGLSLSFGQGIGIGTNNPDNPALTGTGINWFLYEVIIYDRALTSVEINQVRSYLRNKWNI